MGVVDKLINFMKIDDGDDGSDYSEYDDDDYVDPVEEPQKNVSSSETTDEEENNWKVFPPRSNTKGKKMVIPQDNASVCVFRPTSVSESREITQTLRANKIVALNLEDADDLTAQRILDFTSGSCFALDGTLQKISNYIFLVTPSTVDISGDLQDSIAESFGL